MATAPRRAAPALAHQLNSFHSIVPSPLSFSLPTYIHVTCNAQHQRLSDGENRGWNAAALFLILGLINRNDFRFVIGIVDERRRVLLQELLIAFVLFRLHALAHCARNKNRNKLAVGGSGRIASMANKGTCCHRINNKGRSERDEGSSLHT